MNTKSKRTHPDLASCIITIEDVRFAGYCTKGARRWFESYGFDFRDFLTNGITAEKLLSTNDAAAQQVVDRKFGRGP
jgi:nuclear transport factor 2 (NTF2) superfamily protein